MFTMPITRAGLPAGEVGDLESLLEHVPPDCDAESALRDSLRRALRIARERARLPYHDPRGGSLESLAALVERERAWVGRLRWASTAGVRTGAKAMAKVPSPPPAHRYRADPRKLGPELRRQRAVTLDVWRGLREEEVAGRVGFAEAGSGSAREASARACAFAIAAETYAWVAQATRDD